MGIVYRLREDLIIKSVMKAKNKKIVKAKIEEAVNMLENAGVPSGHIEDYITEMLGTEYQTLEDSRLEEVELLIEYVLAIRIPNYGNFEEVFLQKKELLGLQ